ncbi:MAG: HD-GYP domain-containing protein [Nitrospirae bacterium]|nr:HD-GYP domain-containing protein [Nitrospirota bacterium]
MNSLKHESASRALLKEYIEAHKEIIDALPHPSFISDDEFNIAFFSSSMKRLFSNFDNPEKLKCCELFHPPCAAPRTCPLADMLKEGKKGNIEIYAPLPEKRLLVDASALIYKGEFIGALHCVTDISAIKKTEEDYEALIDVYAEAINEMKERELRARKGREAFFNMLEDLNESYGELEELFIKLISVMINSLDAKSPWTKGHSERVSQYAEQIAREMLIDSDEIKNIRLAGLLHDIGKIGTIDYLLDKPGRLTPEEFEIVKRHPAQGAAILREIKQLKDVIPFIEYHHEKIDGTGYPYRLKGDEIPVGARILHVADSYDSMTSDRPYRAAPGIEFALAELHRHRGRQFDPDVVEAFMRALSRQKTEFRV